MTAGADTQAALTEAIRREGLDTVEGAFAYAGGSDRVKGGLGHRRRTQVFITDSSGVSHELYLKRYQREPLAWRLRRMWTYGPLSGSPAAVEYANLEQAHRAGVPTMTAVAHGQDGGRLGGGRSYIIVTAVPGEAIERCYDDLLRRGLLDVLTERLVELVRTLHRAGLVHRDLYTAHVFANARGRDVSLHLIDLGRVFGPRWRPFRWRVKDLAQLKYSMPQEWVERYWSDFLAGYLAGWQQQHRRRYDRAISRKLAEIRNRHRRRVAAHRRKTQGQQTQ